MVTLPRAATYEPVMAMTSATVPTPAPTKDLRPAAALGHAFLRVHGVAAAAKRLEAVGLRRILARADFAIFELRGGTHVVVREREDALAEDQPASFDLMYDDLGAARARFLDAGFEASAIVHGRIHAHFVALAPEGFSIEVVSSHAGRRPV